MTPKSYIPGLIAIGFALLFLSTFFTNNNQSQNILNRPNGSNLPLVSSSSANPNIPTNVVGQKVNRVIDGDTVELSGGTRVRLIGIDTPESGDCYFLESKNALVELVEGKNVALEKDIQEKDKYGRTLAYIYVDSTFVNEKMIQDGHAKTLTIPPDIKYTDIFVKAQVQARENKQGLWADNICENQPLVGDNQDFDVQNTQNSVSPNGCLIKGNISSSGEKIYHSPGQRYYEKTQIDEGAGERWFCSESEAENSGWRKSKV